MTIAVSCSNVLIIFGLVAAFGCTTIVYIFPASFYLKLSKKKNGKMYWMAIVAIIVGGLAFLMALCGAVTNMWFNKF